MASTEPECTESDYESEYRTRIRLIDSHLESHGWTRGKDWFEEQEYPGMPNSAGKGYVDYVLTGSDGRPLAIIEAKRTTRDVHEGRHQAELYADLVEREKGRRPVIFLCNGYETTIIDDAHGYPERRIFGVYSKEDLERLVRTESNRDPVLTNAVIDETISGRYYQKAAIRAVCESFEGRRRRALLVMATGSGKTRTTVSLVKTLVEKGWVNRVLFLADRTALVKQAKRDFDKFLPDFPKTNLCRKDRDLDARMVFSTYETMINTVDRERHPDGSVVFSVGHFDLLITDEAHRSIYNKYGTLFTYFDSLLLGLTATPKGEIDRDTYSLFQVPKGMPTFNYGLPEAVRDGFLVPYHSVETSLKFQEEGIVYDDLPEDEKREYEDRFMDLDGNVPERVDANALNEWVFNHDTIARVLQDLVERGYRTDLGKTLGKTIIFARTHLHAERILEVFNELYPSMAGQCVVIDNKIEYADDLIDRFHDGQGIRIAISVDMMDTGIDIPEVMNLVFFKKVYSRTKFWQMIGRGTRLCPGLRDGRDKEDFLIFDYCGNFRFFRVNPQGKELGTSETVQGRLFARKLQLIGILGDIRFRELSDMRRELVEDVCGKIRELNTELFSVRAHLRCIEMYSYPSAFDAITEDDVAYLRGELEALIDPYDDDKDALSFDYAVYSLEVARAQGKGGRWAVKQVRARAEALGILGSIPEVVRKADLIETVRTPGYLEQADIPSLEEVRRELRDLMKYIDKVRRMVFDTDFRDAVVSFEENDAELADDGMGDYRTKAQRLVREHMNDGAVGRMYRNEPLLPGDVEELQRILWSEAGTREDFERESSSEHIGVFIRDILGLDRGAVMSAFSQFLDEAQLNSAQVEFVRNVAEYLVRNGTMMDMTVLQRAPFDADGGIVRVFGNDMGKWTAIRRVIEDFNGNAESV